MDVARWLPCVIVCVALTLGAGCASAPDAPPPGSIESDLAGMPRADEWSVDSQGAASGAWFFDARARRVALVEDGAGPAAAGAYAWQRSEWVEGSAGGAVGGALVGAGASVLLGCGYGTAMAVGGGPLGTAIGGMMCVAGIALAPVTGAVGAVAGYAPEARAETHLAPVSVQRLEGPLERLVAQSRQRPPARTIIGALAEVAPRETGHATAPARLERNDRGGMRLSGPFDGALGVSIDGFGLVTRKKPDDIIASDDPEVRLWLHGAVTSYTISAGWLVHHKDGAVTYAGPTHRVSALTADGGALLARELEQACVRLAGHIAGLRIAPPAPAEVTGAGPGRREAGSAGEGGAPACPPDANWPTPACRYR